jgi:PadR family transcriptional regulator, regulatory protein AphA
MRLKPPAYMLLGMLRLGATSGYAIKKAADASTRYFWPTSLAQVYPELARLEQQGLVSRRDDSHGARARSAYAITPDGEAALLAWLRSEREAPVQLRDEGLLRLFFADALPGEDQLTLVRRLRRRAQGVVAYMQAEGIPFAEVQEAHDTHFPVIAARFGADLWAFTEQWLAKLEAELDFPPELEGPPEPKARPEPETTDG